MPINDEFIQSKTTVVLLLNCADCDVYYRAFCDCAVNETTRQVLRDVQLGYYYAMVNLTETRKYEKDDFTVVVQQHLVDMEALTDVRRIHKVAHAPCI